MFEKKVSSKPSILGICLSAMVFFILCAVFSSAAERADYFDTSGKQVRGDNGEIVNVDFSDRSYTVKIDSISESSVIVYVNGEGPKTIREHETALFDRTKEGTAVSIEVIGVSTNYTNLRLRRVQGITPVEPVVESPAYIVEDTGQAEESQTQQETAGPKCSASTKIILGVLGVVAFVVVVFFVRSLMKKKSRPAPKKIVLKKAKRRR